MAKKALVDPNHPKGINGYRVLEVVDTGNEFEVHSSLVWKDCPDHVTQEDYWYQHTTNTFKKLPHMVNPIEILGELIKDEKGIPTEEYVWDWEQETYTSKVNL